MYGAGIENIGRQGQPECLPVPQPEPDQILVRVDAVSLCLSDVKLIKQGGRHPKLYNRDLAVEPTRLGHEVALTVMKVGDLLKEQVHPGDRLALQPDIYQDGKSTAYGYTLPGGLIQYHTLGVEVMHADAGCYLLPVEGELGYAEAALTEPWACVVAAYTQRRRLSPKPGGCMWILGRRDDPAPYELSTLLEAPSALVVSDVPPLLMRRIQEQADCRGITVTERSELSPADFPLLLEEFPHGFDDIIWLDPRSGEQGSAAARLIARRGTFNLVGRSPLDQNPLIDVGRIHYDYTAYLGTSSTVITDAYGESRNRCELRSGGTALFVGAGGPMGQMHLQRALEMQNGPAVILAADINPGRLQVLADRFGPLAQRQQKRLAVSNSTRESFQDFVRREAGVYGVDDCIVCVPSAEVMAEAAQTLNQDGMLILFAGVPNGTLVPLNLSDVYLHQAQFTGTSGSTLEDQKSILGSALAGELSPNQSMAAIGGMQAAQEGIRAMMEGRFPGKIVIFPQINQLPLTGLSELKNVSPEVAEVLGPGDTWTRLAEAALIENWWKR
jgi:threonine dehydrogenase-like Zn-dependent dehydrogenase